MLDLGRFSLILMWWQSLLGRVAVHLPWILSALAYFVFLIGEQGQTALEYPVERPLTAIFVVGTLIGMCVHAAWLLTRGHQATVPLVTLADIAPDLMPGLRDTGGPRRPIHWGTRALKIVLGVAIARAVLIVAWQHPVAAIVLALAVAVGAVIAVRFPAARWSSVVTPFVLWGVFTTGVMTVASNSALDWLPVLPLALLALIVVGGPTFRYLSRLTATTEPPPMPLILGVAAAIGLPMGLLISNNPRAPVFFFIFWLAVAFGALVIKQTGVLAVGGLRWVAQKTRGAPPGEATRDFVAAASPAAIAMIVYAGGIYLVTHHLDELVALGSHALVASGLLAMTVFCTGLLYLLVTRATLRAGWLLLAIFVAVYLIQDPLEERPNPLLAKTPTIEQAQIRCAPPTVANQAAPGSRPDQSLAQATAAQASAAPSILVSAEGGGIRAAYWTAVSLEELSQARKVPLVTDAAILSGVSGGSLGIATFLAAQDLPVQARLPCIREFLSGDFLSPLLAGLLFLDVPRLILPTWLLDKHRGDYFEDFMARRWRALTGSGYFYRPLTRAAGAAGDGQRSAKVYFNATDAFSGQFIALTSRQGDTAGVNEQLSLSPLNGAVLDRLPDLRIAEAVHMSARFPYVSPNPDLRAPAKEFSRVLFGQDAPASALEDPSAMASLASLVDGGYFDNSGLWPALRLLERERNRNPRPERFIIHILNDQTRGCRETPSNTGCNQAGSRLIQEERLSNRGGWLSRPTQAIQAVRSEHSLQSVTALELAQSQLKAKPLVWKVPMPDLRVAPWIVEKILAVAQWLPIHGRDLRYGGVALAWTLAPEEREFLCIQAAAIRKTGVPGIQSPDSIDRSKECASAPKERRWDEAG